jgi:hypothetical protein
MHVETPMVAAEPLGYPAGALRCCAATENCSMRLSLALTSLALLAGLVSVNSASAQTAPAASAQAPTQNQETISVQPPHTPPAPAPNAPAAASTADNNSGPGLYDVVCKPTPPPIGSRLGGGRECHTRREWWRRAMESQKILRRAQAIGLTGQIY